MAKIIGNPTVTPINTYTKKEVDKKLSDIQVGGGGTNEIFIINLDDNFNGDKTYEEIVDAIDNKKEIIVAPSKNRIGKAIKQYMMVVEASYDDDYAYLRIVRKSANNNYKCHFWNFACSSSNKWELTTTNLVDHDDILRDASDIESGNSNKVPSALAVKNYVQEKTQNSGLLIGKIEDKRFILTQESESFEYPIAEEVEY